MVAGRYRSTDSKKHHLDLARWVMVARRVYQVVLQVLLLVQLTVAVIIVVIQIGTALASVI
jgi:hypothetical protein